MKATGKEHPEGAGAMRVVVGGYRRLKSTSQFREKEGEL